MNNEQRPASFLITLDDYIAQQQKAPEIADRLGSDDVQKAIGKIAEEFSLDPSALSVGVEYAILKKDMAVYLPNLLQENLNINLSLAVKVAKAAAEKVFPVFKTRLAEKEKYQGLWKDIVKAPLPMDAPKGREAKASLPVAAPTAAMAEDASKSNFEKRAAAESEVEITKKKRIAEAVAASVKSLDEALSLKTKSIIAQSNLTFADPNLQKRLEMIISARLRDVRDESETKEMLMRGDKVGGLGLNAEQTQRVLSLLSAATAEFQDAYKKEEEAKRASFLKEQMEKEALRKAQKERSEREEREKLYARLTSAGPTVKKLEVKSSKLGEAPKLPTPNSQLPTTRPKMDEVKFTPKVTGPVEELRVMTLTEFHRLSKDSKEAAAKIKDKIDLLGEEDFGKLVAGIKAWQESGVNKLYLELLKESLGRGVPVLSVIEEAAGAGKETLTKEEFNAIMELNKSLRF